MVDVKTAPARPVTDDGDHDRYAHWVDRGRIVEANVTGRPAVALCGKTWIPDRVPDGYPVCPDCDRIKGEMFHDG